MGGAEAHTGGSVANTGLEMRDKMSDKIYTLNELQSLLLPVFRHHDVRRAVLFGSYGKGKADSQSDVDLLVDSDLRGLRFVGLIEDVRSALEKEVDVLDVSHIVKGSEIDSEIKRTGILLYEK